MVSNVTLLNRLQDSAGTIADAQFAQNVGNMIFDCTFREYQCGRNLAIAVSPGH